MREELVIRYYPLSMFIEQITGNRVVRNEVIVFMKKRAYLFILCLFLMILSGCSTISPFIAGVATTTSYPASAQYITSDGEVGTKEGRASAYMVLGIIAVGDASVTKAARQAGITNIKTIDYEYENVLAIVYGRYTTIVTGD